MLQSYFEAITYHNKYLIAIYDVSGMLIFDVDFKGHPRSTVKTLKVVPHLKMFIKPLRCYVENVMLLRTFAQSF